MVVGLTNRQWDGLRAATGLQVEFDQLALRLGVSLAREGARFKARNEITALLKPWFRAHRVEDFARSFDEHGVTWSGVSLVQAGGGKRTPTARRKI